MNTDALSATEIEERSMRIREKVSKVLGYMDLQESAYSPDDDETNNVSPSKCDSPELLRRLRRSASTLIALNGYSAIVKIPQIHTASMIRGKVAGKTQITDGGPRNTPQSLHHGNEQQSHWGRSKRLVRGKAGLYSQVSLGEHIKGLRRSNNSENEEPASVYPRKDSKSVPNNQ